MSGLAEAPRKRLSHSERRAQLMQVAREFIRDEGVDALTLALIAERAGVTKPLVYQHFGSKVAVLAEIYQEFKARTHTALSSALESAPGSLESTARIIADAYIDCIDAEESEVPGVQGALSGSAEMERLRQEADVEFSSRCRAALAPFATEGDISPAAMDAILGAADGLARSIVLESISSDQARDALTNVIIGVTA